MRAKFIGKSSCGFISGKEYDLYTKCMGMTYYGIHGYFLCIYDSKNPNNWCPYTNLEKFLENWRLL